MNVEKFMAVVRKYTSFEELTPTLCGSSWRRSWCMSAGRTSRERATRTLRFIILLWAGWTCLMIEPDLSGEAPPDRNGKNF